MPGNRVHTVAGVVFGGTTAFLLSDGESDLDRIIETAGGLLGGTAGGKLPDLLEPSFKNPNHRSLFHGALPNAAVGFGVVSKVQEWQDWLRNASNRQYSLAASETNPAIRALRQLAGFLLRLLVGVLAGLVAGYASHIILDAFTPRGLPVVA